MYNGDESFAEETLDLKKIIKKYIYLWPWFVISILVSLGIAFFFNAQKDNIYQNHLVLLVKEDSSPLSLEDQISSNLFTVSNIHIQNQIGILTSRTLTRRTLEALDFTVEYYLVGSFGNRKALYPNPFFRVELDSAYPQAINAPYKISRNKEGVWSISAQWQDVSLYSFSSETFSGRAGEVEFSGEVQAGEWLETPQFRFRIIENPNNLPESKDDFVVFLRDISTQTRQYQRLQVEEIRNSTMLKLTINGRSRRKNEAFLNMHAEKFLQRDLNRKSLKAQKTIDFIEGQLIHVSQMLRLSEASLKDFRSEEQILNIDFQSQRTYEQMEQLQHKKAQLIIKENYYNYLSEYLEQSEYDGSELIAPSSLGVDDPILSELINQLMQLYTERSELLINSKRDNPFLTNVESRIIHTKRTIKESLNSIKHANSLSIANLDERIDDLSKVIRLIPQSQTHLFNIERQFSLHDALYTLLQSKKSEIEISKAGLTPVHEIIDTALATDGTLVSPNKKTTYILSFFIGFLLPLLVVFTHDFFNDKIRSDEAIESIGYYPILGYIANNPKKEGPLISFSKNSIQAESFRSVRTNAQFVLPPNDVPVVMVTSTLFEEGKTFVSYNLAAAYASMNKKTALLSFDLRKPKLSKYLRRNHSIGLSNYLSTDLKVNEIICKSHVDNLDIAFSGPIPPNPAELLNSSRIEGLFDFLKDNYDIIIIDTPPAGMVTDALILVRHVNAIMYIVRHNRTPVKHLQHTLKNFKEKGINNVNIVLNDTPIRNRSYQNYSYGYNYGYIDKS